MWEMEFDSKGRLLAIRPSVPDNDEEIEEEEDEE